MRLKLELFEISKRPEALWILQLLRETEVPVGINRAQELQETPRSSGIDVPGIQGWDTALGLAAFQIQELCIGQCPGMFCRGQNKGVAQTTMKLSCPDVWALNSKYFMSFLYV